MRTYAGAVNYRDDRGEWQSIDNTLEPRVGGDWALENKANRYKLLVPRDLSTTPVRVQEDGSWLSMQLEGAKGAPRSSKGLAEFVGALQGVDVAYEAEPEAIKETMTLASAAAPGTYRFAVQASADLSARETNDGGIEFTDGSGRPRFTLPAPFMYDSSTGPDALSSDVSLELAKAGSNYIVTVRADRGWLDNPKRKYPVVIDPTVRLAGADGDCFIDQHAPTTSFCNWQERQIGWDGFDHRTLLRFDVNNRLPQQSAVLDAKVGMYLYGRTTTNTVPVELRRLTSGFNSAATWNSRDGASAWGTPGGDFVSTVETTTNVGATLNSWYYWQVPRLAKDWTDGKLQNLGLILKGPGSSVTNRLAFTSSNDPNVNYRPFLDVTYEPRLGLQPHYTFASDELTDRLSMNVNVANGNLVLAQNEFTIGGTKLDLSIDRYYNNLANDSPDLSRGWRLSPSHDVRLSVLPDGSVNYLAPSGYAVLYKKNADGSFSSPAGINATLERQPDTSYWLKFDASAGRLEFSSAGKLTAQVEKNGNRISFSYRGDGRLQSITDTKGRMHTISYLANGRFQRVTDSTGRFTEYLYDANNRLSESVNLAGKHTDYDYDASANLIEIEDPLGHLTRFTYDAQRRVTSVKRVTDPATGAGDTTTYTYSSGAPCTAQDEVGKTVVTDPRGNATTYCYDQESRVKRVIDAVGNTRSLSYTPNNDLEKFTAPSGQSSQLSYSMTYDGNNNLKDATTPTGAKSSWTYGSGSLLHFPTKYTDPQNRSQVYGYDTNGNLTTITDDRPGPNNVITFYYNTSGAAKGTLSRVRDADGTDTFYFYDPTTANLTSIDRPNPLGDETFTYDALSRLRTARDGKLQTRTFDYDAMDRVIKISYSDGSSVTYVRDANGSITQRLDSFGVTDYDYDTYNRLIEEEFNNSDRNTYAYDKAGNLASLTDAGGTVTYSSNSLNLLDRLTEPGGQVTTFHYDPDNNRDRIYYPNGVTLESGYDGSDRLTSVVGKRGATTLTSYTYNYKIGTQDTDLRQSVSDHEGRSTTYQYDVLNRLVHATTTRGGPVTEDYGYDYDADSNRIRWTFSGPETGYGYPLITYTYNAANELLTEGGRNYTYDANGNETRYRDPNGSGRDFTYNIRDQATRVSWTSGWTMDFAYAGEDQSERVRSGSTKFINNALGVGGKGTTYWTRDENGGLLSQRSPAGRHYYLTDGLGSVVAVTDSSGNVVKTYRYDPFGRATSETGSFSNPWRFTGGYYDGDADAYKMGYRWYSVWEGRWTQQDPIQSPGDLQQANRYAYVGGDPVNGTDPTGTNIFKDAVHYVKKRWNKQGKQITRGVRKWIDFPDRVITGWSCGRYLGGSKQDACDPFEWYGFQVEPAY